MTDKSLRELATEFNNNASEIEALEAKVKALRAQQAKLKAKFVENIGEESCKTIGNATIKTWVTRTKRIDLKALIAGDPDTYEQYKKPDTIAQYASVTIA